MTTPSRFHLTQAGLGIGRAGPYATYHLFQGERSLCGGHAALGVTIEPVTLATALLSDSNMCQNCRRIAVRQETHS